jgi:hypothetical protein
MAVIVDAVQRVSGRWSAPHVRKEGLKGLLPAFTDSDAATSIVFVATIFGIIAPAVHRLPGCVLASHTRDARVPMRGVALPDSLPRFPVQASTALGVTLAQVVASHDRVRPTIAAARPENASATAVNLVPNNQSAKPLAGESDNSHVNYFTASEAHVSQ